MKRALLCMLSVSAGLVIAQSSSMGADSWPQWEGPQHDNISPDKGLLKSWPKEGPKLLWKFDDCGKGYATVSIADGMIFTAGDFGDDSTVIALDMNGKLKWKGKGGRGWKASYPGSRGTPTYNDGMVYYLSGSGSAVALDAKTGATVWEADVTSAYEAKCPQWGMAESLYVDGDNVLCTPGGSKGFMVALNKKTGKVAWVCDKFKDTASYCSPVVVDAAGIRQIITMGSKNVVGIDAKNGALLWSNPKATQYNVHATTPVYKDGCVYVTSGYGSGCMLLKIGADGKSVSEVWSSKDLDDHHGGVVLLDGHIYGSGDKSSGWWCLDFKTGKKLWNNKGVGKGSVTYADGMLYCLGEGGAAALVEASPAGYKEVSRFDVPQEAKDTFWAHPVVCGGRLYIRHANFLYAYDVKK